MPDRVITAEAVISAKDGTGDVFAQIARKLGEVGKGAKASAEVERLSKSLADATKQAEKIGQFRVASKGLDAASLSMAKARQTAAQLAKQIEGMDRPTATLTGKLTQAEREVTRATDAFKRQGAAVREARSALDAAGVPLGRLGAEQTRLKSVIEGTTRAIEAQIGVERRAAEAAEQVAAAQRSREKAEIAAGRAAHAAAERRAEGIAHHGIGHYVAGAAAGAVSAHGVMSALEKALEAGAERQTTLIGMKNAGMGDEEIKRAVDLATRVSRDAPNLDVSQILELHKEARSGVSHPEEAFELMPDLARATSVLKGMGAGNANIADIVKGGESLGLMNDPRRFHAYLDSQVRAMKVMGKTITTEQVYEAAKYSKAAGGTLSDDFLNLTMPSLIQEMHGSSAGDALSSLTKTLRGGLQHKHVPVTRLLELGLLEDPSKIRRSKSGEILGYTGKVKGDDLLATDPDRWFLEYLDRAAEAHGYTKLADKTKLLSETLPGTAANLGRIVIQQRESLTNHRQLYRSAPNLDQSVELQKHDPRVAMATFTAALNDLEAAVTGPAMDALSLGLGGIAGKIRDLADAAKAHPDIAMGVGAGVAGAGLLASGTLGYYVATGFGLPSAATKLTEAAEAIILAEKGGHGLPGSPSGTPPEKDGKRGGTSFGNGRWLAFGAGLAGVVLNAPGVDQAGGRERDANSKALDGLGSPLDALTDRLFGQGRKAGDVIADIWAGMHAKGVPLPPDRYAYAAPNTDGNALHRWDEVGPRRDVALPALVPPPVAEQPAPPFHPDDRRDRAEGYARPNREAVFDAAKAWGLIPGWATMEAMEPSAPRPLPPSTMLPADAAERGTARQEAVDRLKGDVDRFDFVVGQLDGRAGLLQASFTTLDGGAGTLNTSLGALGTGVGSTAHEVDVLGLAARTAAVSLASLLAAAGSGGLGGGGGSGLIRASFGGGGADDGSPVVGGAGTVDKSLPKEARAFLDTISSGEAHGYNVLNGGGTFGDLSHHPGGRAAGRYQDLPSTWRRISGALGLHDFSPLSQDRGNWWLAQQDYRAHTGRELLGDLRSRDPARIAAVGRALHSTWVSTNGSFARKFDHFLGAQHEEHPALAAPPLPRRAPGEGAPAGHATTARLEGKIDRLALALESGGSLHRIELKTDRGVTAKKVYSRGSTGPTIA